jgi:two-component system sensor histidine kinase BaeS
VITLGLVVGGATLLVGVVGAVALRALPSVRLQLAGLAVVFVVLPLASVLLSGLVMFHMGADLAILAVSAAAALGGLVGAFVLERGIVRRLDQLRIASERLSSGQLDARVPPGGPTELAHLAKAFNAMADNLEHTFDSRRELVAWASHDLRAPISSLQAMLEAIEDRVVEPEHYLQSLQGQVRLLSVLVDDLFELACIDAGAMTLDVEVTDLGELVRSVAHRHDAELRAKGLRLEVDVRGSANTAACAPDKIERVVSNLVVNSLRYTPAGGRVVVSVTSAAGASFITVEDSGVGIAPEAVARVFEPFYRADAARTPSDGSGLGLAIAKGLIEAHGGRIWVERPPGGGTRVCFALPSASQTGSRTGSGPRVELGPVVPPSTGSLTPG